MFQQGHGKCSYNFPDFTSSFPAVTSSRRGQDQGFSLRATNINCWPAKRLPATNFIDLAFPEFLILMVSFFREGCYLSRVTFDPWALVYTQLF